MADEATVGVSLVFDKNADYMAWNKTGMKSTVAGTEFLRNKQLVGTAAEALVLSDVAKGGLAAFHNTHASAVIEIRSTASAADLVRLESDDVALFRIADDATPYVISSVAGAGLEYVLIDP